MYQLKLSRVALFEAGLERLEDGRLSSVVIAGQDDIVRRLDVGSCHNDVYWMDGRGSSLPQIAESSNFPIFSKKLAMPEYSFVLAGRVGVGKSSLFSYVKNGMAPPDYSGDISRRTEDYGLENLTYETKVNGRDASVSMSGSASKHLYGCKFETHFAKSSY